MKAARVLAGVLTVGAWMPATADIYHWIDNKGTMHFSDRPPSIEDQSEDGEAAPEPVDTPQNPPDSAGIPDEHLQAPAHDSPAIGENIEENIGENIGAETPPALSAIAPDEDSVQAPCIGDRCLDARPVLAPPLPPLNDQGDIKIGMTKRQVIAIWGSPDHARRREMPEGAVNEWFYEEGPGFTQRVFFRGGKVVRVEVPPVPRP